jgi:hypothetical protein
MSSCIYHYLYSYHTNNEGSFGSSGVGNNTTTGSVTARAFLGVSNRFSKQQQRQQRHL